MQNQNNQNYFILQERDGREVYIHGVIRAPEGKTRADVARIYRAVMDASEEWNYGDILSALDAEGFTLLAQADRFWEDEA